jgi:molybdate transport system substrate-binding protein
MRFAARFVSTLLLLNVSVSLSSVIAQTKQAVLVAAAADMQPLQNQLREAFFRTTGGEATFIFAASGSLAQQIRNGAPYDVYLSANQVFVKQSAESGHLLRDSVQVYAYGRIALWSKSGGIHTLEDLVAPSVQHLAIANPIHAPYGAAAQAALKSQGYWEKLQAKLVYGENVEQTFQYAESGNADAAIVGWSQVFNKRGILLPAAWHPRISQTGAVVKGSRNPGLARRFMTFLTGKEGRAVLRQFGFDLPD